MDAFNHSYHPSISEFQVFSVFSQVAPYTEKQAGRVEMPSWAAPTAEAKSSTSIAGIQERGQTTAKTVGPTASSDDAKFHATNQARLALIEKEMSNEANREDIARLRLLTARVRALDPAVSTDQFVELTAVTETLEQSTAKLLEIRRKFKLG